MTKRPSPKRPEQPLLPTSGRRPRSPAEMLEPARAPSRPRGSRMRSEPTAVKTAVRFISSILTLILLMMAVTAGAGLVLYHQFERPGPLEVSRAVAIPKGEGRIDIAARLEREGVISNRWTFIVGHLMQSWFGAKKKLELKAGEYEIKKNASMREVLETLAEGKSILYKLTIPEGLTSQQIVERVNADPNLTGEILEVPAEGTLLPDTYRFSKGTERSELIARMRAEMTRFVTAAWEKRKEDHPLKSIEEAITFASIVEKETGRADERDKVAAVFINRLRKGMRLQSDPTIIYGIVGGQGPLGRSITRADIDQKTEYNTYQIDGLPPGPICNPGRSAIEATLNPAATNDLYFVADGTGGHEFSETLKEHNAAVVNWRRLEKEAREKREKDNARTQQAAATPSQTEAPVASDGKPAIPVPMNAAAAKADAQADSKGEKQKAEKGEKPAAQTNAMNVPLPVRKPKR
jgi:UPF0755 protein